MLEMFQFIFVSVMAFILNGCGDFSSPVTPSTHVVGVSSQSQAMAEALGAKVSCYGIDCHESVGMLSIILPQLDSTYSVGICSAFVVADNIVATNAHCVPEDLRRVGASCKNRIWLNLPQTALSPANQIACSEIINVSSIEEKKGDHQYLLLPDFAFLKFNHSIFRPKLSFSQKGLPDNERLTSVKVDPYPSSTLGRMVKTQCSVIQNSVLLPSFNHALKPIATLIGCDSIPGNSGSPLLDNEGYVRAVLHGGNENNEYPNFSVATNAACMPSAEGTSTPAFSPECFLTPASIEAKKITLEVPQEVAEKNAKALDENIKNWGDLVEPRFEWMSFPIQPESQLGQSFSIVSELTSFSEFMQLQEVLLYAGAQIRCFKNPSQWLKKYRNWFVYDSEALVELDSPLWIMKLGIDRSYRVGISSKETFRNLHLQVRFSPKTLHKTGKSKVTLIVKEWLKGDFKIGEGVVSTCP